MKVTLTFDNGPHPEVTPQVLEVLRDHGIRAHFFVVGSKVREHGDTLLAAALAQGHRIGNHSFTHSTPLGRLSGELGVTEVRLTEQLLDRVGAAPRIFRPFGDRGVLGPHLLSPDVWNYLRRGGYSCVLWNCLAYEWDAPDAWVTPTFDRCMAREHSVVVLHDVATGAMDHLGEFIDRLQAGQAEFSLAFPSDCLPMSEGNPMWSAVDLEKVISPG